MLSKLEMVPEEYHSGYHPTLRYPNNKEVMEKVNEIIDVVNKLNNNQSLDEPLKPNPFRSHY